MCVFPPQREGTRNIIPLGTVPLATIEKFNKMVSPVFYFSLVLCLILLSLGKCEFEIIKRGRHECKLSFIRCVILYVFQLKSVEWSVKNC